MDSISGYRGNINVYTPARPVPPPVVIYEPSRRPVPPSVDVYIPSRPVPPMVDVHTSRRGNEVIDDYRTGTKTTIVEHGRRAGEVIHSRIR